MDNPLDLNQILSTIINIIILPVLPVLTSFIIAFLRKKISELKGNMENMELLKHMDMAENAIISSVAAVNQLYVDNLKRSNGNLSSEEKNLAFTMARERVLRILGEKGKQTLGKVYKDIDYWIDSRIEYHVSQSKFNS